MPDSQRLEIGGGLIRVSFHVGKCKIDMLALVVRPDQSYLLRFFGSPRIDHIIAEVEVVRNLYLEVLLEIFLRLESRLI